MGIPGAGKSRLAEDYVERGYVRLNRDERGGSLRDLADALDEALAAGARAASSSTTPTSRARRGATSLEAAARHGVAVRCVWLDTPLAQAQVNLVERLLDRFGALPAPEELRALARKEPGLLAPTSQMRAVRELEPPSADEGFAAIEHVPFAREPHPERTRAGVFVAAAALPAARRPPTAPHLVFDWRPERRRALVEVAACDVTGPVEVAVCPHRGGPPTLLVPPAAARPRRSRSRAGTGSTRRARPSSARAPRTARSRPRSARPTSRLS